MPPPLEPLHILRRLQSEFRAGRHSNAPIHRGPIEREADPFRTLVGCLISQRARDEQTARICDRLFAVADTPEAILGLPPARLRSILHGAGFFRQKAARLRGIARDVLRLGGVPRTREELMRLPGIGPKCANIVLARCFGHAAIAVDIHVHRISNRLGLVRTRTPEQTEAALTPLIPVRWRSRVNRLLVAHGQLVCRPIRPRCDACPVESTCPRRGV